MTEIHYLNRYNMVIVRYNSEIWLKSRKVKIRMLKSLINNIIKTLKNEGIKFHKYQLSQDSARIFFFFNNEDIPQAINALKNVLGIATISPALRTSCNIENISERAIQVGNEILHKNNSFALRVKRTGKHDYSSYDIASKVGQDIVDHFKELNLSVNLTNPEKKIFIEVRHDFSYVFTNIIESKWSGLPIESNKRILVMDIGKIDDLISGFMIMKRGCKLYPILFNLAESKEHLKNRLHNWKEVFKYASISSLIVRKIDVLEIMNYIATNISENKYLCALCRLLRFDITSRLLKMPEFKGIKGISDGTSLNNSSYCPYDVDFQSLSLNYLFSEYPIYTSLICLNSIKINELKEKISRDLKLLDYCSFKPKNQELNLEKVKVYYKSLDLKEFIQESLNVMKKYSIN